MEKISVYYQSKNFVQVLVHYSLSDDFADFLDKLGRKINLIAYGYMNEFDLIIYEVV